MKKTALVALLGIVLFACKNENKVETVEQNTDTTTTVPINK